MTFQISRRGKKYLEVAQTLLRAAETMTDRAIAGQLKALADDYQRRAEKASDVDAAKALARSAVNAEGADATRGERWDARRATQSRAFYSFVIACGAFTVRADIPHEDRMIGVISSRADCLTADLTDVWSEYGRNYSICPKVRARASPPNSTGPRDIRQHLSAG
jgi:hypothetical protein